MSDDTINGIVAAHAAKGRRVLTGCGCSSAYWIFQPNGDRRARCPDCKYESKPLCELFPTRFYKRLRARLTPETTKGER